MLALHPDLKAKSLKSLTWSIEGYRNGRGEQPRGQKMQALAEALDVSLAWLRGDSEVDNSPPAPQHTSAETSSPARELMPERLPFRPSSLPILGIVVGSARGVPVLTNTEVDRIDSPADLADVNGAYALYVVESSMEPVFSEGMIVGVHPHLPPRHGDDVVVQFTNGQDRDAVHVMLKRYVSRTKTHIKLEQFNPAKKIEIALKDVVNVHTVVYTKRR